MMAGKTRPMRNTLWSIRSSCAVKWCRSIQNWGRTHCCPLKPVPRSRTWVARLVSEAVARRDAGPEPTWTYLRRVSETSLATHVRSETLHQNSIQSLRSSRWNISLWDSTGSNLWFPQFCIKQPVSRTAGVCALGNNMSDKSTGQTVVPKLPKNFFAAIRQWRIVPMSFVETSLFSRNREQYLDDEQFRLLQASLLISPDAGPVIRESGGIRKLRWGSGGSGKRSGLRIIYYRQRSANRIYLLTVYRKSEMSDMSKAELRILKALVREIEQTSRGLPDGKKQKPV